MHACAAHAGFASTILLAQILALQIEAEVRVNRIEPPSLLPGRATEITIFGNEMGFEDEPVSLRTSFPSKIEILTPLAVPKKGQVLEDGKIKPEKAAARKKFRARITLPRNSPIRIGTLRVGCFQGVSNPTTIVIDDLATINGSRKNHSRESAQVISIPAAVQSQSDGDKEHFYKLSATGGLKLSVELLGQRLGSGFDGVLRLLDANGSEVLYHDDDESTGADPRLSHVFAEPGVYYIAVKDIQQRSNLTYRLRVGDFPLISSPFPIGTETGTTEEVVFATKGGPRSHPIEIKATETEESRYLGVRAQSGNVSAFARIRVTPLPNSFEEEPNDKPDTATAVKLPVALNGRYKSPGDVDWFEFQASKSKQINIRIFSRASGSPAYVALRLFDHSGRELINTEGQDGDDPENIYSVTQDGIYRLAVRELLGGAGDTFVYRIEITETSGSFHLSMKKDRNSTVKHTSSPGRFIILDVTCRRNSYSGPINLTALGDHEPYTILGGLIPTTSNPNETSNHRVFVKMRESMKPGDLELLRIRGQASTETERPFAAFLSTEAAVRQMDAKASPLQWESGLVAVAIAPEADPVCNLSWKPEPIVLVKEIGEAKFETDVERLNKKFGEQLIGAIHGLPHNVQVEVRKQGGGKSEKAEWKIHGKLPDGEWPIKLLSFALVRDGNSPSHLSQLFTFDTVLHARPALNVSLALAGPLTIGQKQKATVKVSRLVDKPEERKPIQLRWLKLPANVQATTPDIPADSNEVEVEFTASENAAPGTFKDLILEVRTRTLGRDIQAKNEPVSLEIKAK